MSDFEGPGEDGMDFDLLEAYGPDNGERAESAEDETTRAQTFREIETEIQELPRVNGKRSSCVTGKKWMLQKRPPLWAVPREA